MTKSTPPRVARAERRAGKPAAAPEPTAVAQSADDTTAPAATTTLWEGVREVPLAIVHEDADLNPRTRFALDDAEGLAASVRDHGILQPILLRPHPDHPGEFRVVMGERRRRAAVVAGLETILAGARELSDAQAFELATIENVQRADMTAIEEGRAFERIIADRQAADPELKLKEAKDTIAAAVKKSTRFVELRLQLLRLPAIKQVEIEQGKLSPKEAILYARYNLPPQLPADRLLLLAEIACACAGKAKTIQASKTARIDGANRDDKTLQAIKSLGLFYVSKDYNTGEDSIYLNAKGVETLAKADQGFFSDPADALRRLQEKTLPADAWTALSAGEQRFHTAWLNPPFAAHPEELRILERKREQDAARKAGDEKRERERARADRDFGRAGQAALARVLELEAEAADLPDPAFATRYREVMAANGWSLPLRIVWNAPADPHHGRGDTVLIDDAGEQMVAGYGALEAMRRMYAIAVNRVSGFQPTAGPPITESRWAEDAAAGLYAKTDDDDPEEGDEGGDAEAAAAPEPQVDLEEPIDAASVEDDAELPGYLRRLAGGAPEARP